MGIASYNKENFNFTIKKIREEWDAVPITKNNVHVATATESVTVSRICFKFQTNECTRTGCPYVHKIMTDQEKKDQKYNNKRPAGKESSNKITKKPNYDKKFKGKKDTRNNNSQGTNWMHNSMPLTREHQVKLGAGQGKPTPSNPNGYSKKQLTILNFLIEQESGSPIKNIIKNGIFSSWGGNSMSAYTRSKSDTHTGGMSFNMFSPAPEISSAQKAKLHNTTLMRCTIERLIVIQRRSREIDTTTAISSDAIHLFTVANTIGGSNLLPVLYENNLLAECPKVNMLGWNDFPSSMTGGYHEGLDEIMLALYKLNEVIFKAIVVYPMMIYNQEAQRYEYKENAFMTFNPSHKNKHDKPYGESGFYRSTVDNIIEYFDKFEALNKETLLEENDYELWLFTMYFDFMSHIAQQLERYKNHGQTLKSARAILCEVVNVCQRFQSNNTEVIKDVMLAIIAEL